MWRKLFDLAKLAVTFGRQVEKQQEDIEALQNEARPDCNSPR
jgi:hypothetical protein